MGSRTGLLPRMSALKLLPFIALLLLLSSRAQAESTANKGASSHSADEQRSYPLILVHSPARLSTMKQFDQNFLSTYRVLSRELEKLSPTHSRLIQLAATLFTLPLSHEEGHRSVLTMKRIGSISRPYVDWHGAAYVEGVSDETLQALRDTDLPSYVRLHAAGLESDYALGNRCASLSAFNTEDLRTIYVECAMRRLNQVFYFASAAIPFMSPELKEEDNELDRDIVGHDVMGAIRHLHRPGMPFFRYTDHSDLSDEEKSFATRAAIRGLANLVTPSLVGRDNWELYPGIEIAAGLGYSLAPFGDFLDQQVWLKYEDDLRVHVYARQYQNKKHWFPAGGANLHDYPLSDRLRIDVSAHVWRQPEGLEFESSQGHTGGLLSFVAKYQVLGKRHGDTELSVDMGITAKSEGFVPEEPYLREKVGLQLGTTIRY